jgi:hypothetical protein
MFGHAHDRRVWYCVIEGTLAHMKPGKASFALFIGALSFGLGAAGCVDDSPQQAPVACASLLSPKTETICNGTSLILTVSDGPPAGSDVVWDSDIPSLTHAGGKAVFTAPSSGSGTTRIRVRWTDCDLTSYIAYEPCDGGAVVLDAAADADADGAQAESGDAPVDAPDAG